MCTCEPGCTHECVCVCVWVHECDWLLQREGEGGEAERELGEGWLYRGLCSPRSAFTPSRRASSVAVGTVRDPDAPTVLLKGTGVDAEPREHSVLHGGGLIPLMSSKMEVGFNCRKVI